jgi:hypothetical protein
MLNTKRPLVLSGKENPRDYIVPTKNVLAIVSLTDDFIHR